MSGKGGWRALATVLTWCQLDRDGHVNRRHMIWSSLSVAGLAEAALAQSPPAPLLFPTGPLSTNALAKRFRAFPSSIKVPSTKLATKHAFKHFADLRGKARILTLWAEWCAPCIAEMKDFAALNRRAGGADFEVVAILTGSQKKLNFEDAEALLTSHQAALPLLVEINGGSELLNSVALPSTGEGTLPCTLIVDRRGVLRGRAFGAAGTRPIEVINGHLTERSKASLLAGAIQTDWATPAADAFVAALKADVLG